MFVFYMFRNMCVSYCLLRFGLYVSFLRGSRSFVYFPIDCVHGFGWFIFGVPIVFCHLFIWFQIVLCVLLLQYAYICSNLLLICVCVVIVCSPVLFHVLTFIGLFCFIGSRMLLYVFHNCPYCLYLLHIDNRCSCVKMLSYVFCCYCHPLYFHVF